MSRAATRDIMNGATNNRGNAVMPAELVAHMRNFGMDSRAIELVRAHSMPLARHIGEVVDAYYAHLTASDLAPLMRADRIDDLKMMRANHWRLLLAADFPAIRAHYAEKMGPRRVDGGFPRSVFILAAEWFAVEFARVVDREEDIPRTIRPALRAALTRFAFFDLTLALTNREIAWID